MKKWTALLMVLCLTAGLCAFARAESGGKKTFTFSAREKAGEGEP